MGSRVIPLSDGLFVHPDLADKFQFSILVYVEKVYYGREGCSN